MALFFDVTDVWDWKHQHLTGVQRVVVHTLRELLRMRPEIVLFRYDKANTGFVEILPKEFSQTVQRDGDFTNKDSAAQSPPNSHGPPRVPPAIRTDAESQKALRRSFKDWILRRADAAVELEPQSTLPDSSLFNAGDICISFGLTWFNPGFWTAVERAKRKHVRWVQLIHDIGFVTHPQWISPDWVSEGEAWWHQVLRCADALIVTSLFQRNEILRYCALKKIAIPIVELLRLGDDPPWLNRPIVALPSAPDLGGRSFVLYVSGFYPRKNHYALYQVWRRLLDERVLSSPDLVLVGEPGQLGADLIGQIKRDPLTRDRVHILHEISDEHLAALYRKCLFTVYPSYYEGWGLPVAESLRLGRFCIASSSASLPEVGGDLLDYVDPIDLLAWFKRITHTIDNPDYVRHREDLIRARYRPTSWHQTGLQVLELTDNLEAILRAPKTECETSRLSLGRKSLASQ